MRGVGTGESVDEALELLLQRFIVFKEKIFLMELILCFHGTLDDLGPIPPLSPLYVAA